jgi:ABC-type transport system involved in multi-copper enzyme maturation permease subunit
VNQFWRVITSELTKIRSVRSMTWALMLTPVICAGLGCAVSLSLRASFPRLPAQQRHDWDPLFATFYSLSVGQLALVVFGVTVTGGEYPTKMIMTSLAVVPRRGLFYAAKVTAGLLAAAGAAVLAVAATFFAAQLALGPHRVSAGTPGTLQAAFGACLYLTLICVLAMGATAITRSPVLSLVVMVPLLFLDSQGLGNVPGLQKVIDYLPDQAGAVITHLSGAGAGHFGRPYGPWTGMAIMLGWTAAALIGGYLVLARTDASGESGIRSLGRMGRLLRRDHDQGAPSGAA